MNYPLSEEEMREALEELLKPSPPKEFEFCFHVGKERMDWIIAERERLAIIRPDKKYDDVTIHLGLTKDIK